MFDISTIGTFLYLIYPIIIISVSIYVSLSKEMNSETFFFANHNTNWFILGISFLASSMFSPYILGFTSSGSTLGISYIYGIISVIMLSILGWFLAPKFIKANIKTIPEFFERRFNKACRLFVSGLYIISNIFFRLLIMLIIGSVFFQMITGIDAYFSLIFLLVITGIYLIIGGLFAELYINVIQISIIVLTTAGIIFWFFYNGQDSLSGIKNIDINSINKWNISYDVNLIEIIAALPIIGFWFWCADQFIVQKLLSGRNIISIRKASLLSAFLQFIPVVLFGLPAILAPIFSPHISFLELSGMLFNEGVLPQILKGALLIAIVAVIITSFSNVINSTATLFTFDFYKSFKPDTSDRKLVLIGRLTIMSLLFISFILIPITQTADFKLCVKLFGMFSNIVVLVSVVFIAALLNIKINSESALITLVLGTITIIIKGIFDILLFGSIVSPQFLNWFIQMNFLQFSLFIFTASILSLFVFNKINWSNSTIIFFKKAISRSISKIKFSLHKRDFLVLPVIVFTSVWCGIKYFI